MALGDVTDLKSKCPTLAAPSGEALVLVGSEWFESLEYLITGICLIL